MRHRKARGETTEPPPLYQFEGDFDFDPSAFRFRDPMDDQQLSIDDALAQIAAAAWLEVLESQRVALLGKSGAITAHL